MKLHKVRRPILSLSGLTLWANVGDNRACHVTVGYYCEFTHNHRFFSFLPLFSHYSYNLPVWGRHWHLDSEIGTPALEGRVMDPSSAATSVTVFGMIS